MESVLIGAAMTAVFGGLMFVFHKSWWMVFPMIFGGVMPLVAGIRQLVEQNRNKKVEIEERSGDAEKQVLRAARDHGGTISASAAALDTSLSLREAQALLDDFAKHGNASMRVLDSGAIVYDFPDLIESSGG